MPELRALATRIFALARIATVIAAILTIVAMFAYPGGTALDATTHGYRFHQNFLSDLGMTISFSGRPNRLGATLFIVSVSLIALALLACLAVLVKLLATTTVTRRLARGAAVIGGLACMALIGVAATPENEVMALHVQFTRWAFRAFPIVALLLALATSRDRRFRRRATIAWLGLTAGLVAYVLMMEWGPSMNTNSGLTFHVIAQKSIVAVGLVALWYHMREAELVTS